MGQSTATHFKRRTLQNLHVSTEDKLKQIIFLIALAFGPYQFAHAQGLKAVDSYLSGDSDSIVLKQKDFELRASELHRYLKDTFIAEKIDDVSLSTNWFCTVNKIRRKILGIPSYCRDYIVARMANFKLNSQYYPRNIKLSCSLFIRKEWHYPLEDYYYEISISYCLNDEGQLILPAFYHKELADYTTVNMPVRK